MYYYFFLSMKFPNSNKHAARYSVYNIVLDTNGYILTWRTISNTYVYNLHARLDRYNNTQIHTVRVRPHHHDDVKYRRWRYNIWVGIIMLLASEKPVKNVYNRLLLVFIACRIFLSIMATIACGHNSHNIWWDSREL